MTPRLVSGPVDLTLSHGAILGLCRGLGARSVAPPLARFLLIAGDAPEHFGTAS
jgi:hypothetical protein